MKLALILAALLLAGCGDASVDDVEQDVPGIAANGRRDLIGTDADVSGLKAGRTYVLYAVGRDRNGSGLAFAEYGCEASCDAIARGYATAKARKIKDARACGGESWGEIEGCVAFTQGLQPTTTRLPALQP